MEPINYSITPANPGASFMQGVQMAQAIKAQSRQAEMQNDLGELAKSDNPTPKDYIRISTKYPELAGKFKDTFSAMGAEQAQNRISSATQVLSALRSGNPDVAGDLLQAQATAARNSGDEQGAKVAEAMAETIKVNPSAAEHGTALTLASAMGPENFAKTFDALYKTPIEAKKLGVEADNAATKTGLENQYKVEQISDSQLDRKVKVLDARIKQEGNDIKRGELQLQLDKLLAKNGDAGKVAQTTFDMLTDQISNLDRLTNSPVAQGGVGGVGSIFQGIAKMYPGSQAKDFNAIVDSVKSQQFLANLAALKERGGTLGQVTEAEGMRMEKAIASLDTDQSPAAFKTAVGVIKKSMERIRNQIVAEGNLPTKKDGIGGAVVIKDSPYGMVTNAMINKTLQDNPGSTREQVIQFLNSKRAAPAAPAPAMTPDASANDAEEAP